MIRIDNECHFNTAEILFDPMSWRDFEMPKPLSQECAVGVHAMIDESIQLCDSYLRKNLYKNVVLAGGTSMFQGYNDRVKQELMAITESHQYIDVISDSQRKYAAWIGGSMYGSLGTFNQIKVTRHEYNDDPDVVHKKYF